MTVTTAVQDAIIRLGQDMTGRGWDLGIGLWGIHPHDDGTVSLEKMGGDGFLDVRVDHAIEALSPPANQHIGYAVMFEVWMSPSGQLDGDGDAPDKVDVRYIVAGLTNGTCVIFEHRRDQTKARVTLDDGSAPPVGMGGLCAHLRSKVTAPAAPALPAGLVEALQQLGLDPSKLDGVLIVNLGDDK